LIESNRQLEISKKWLKAFQGRLEMIKESKDSYTQPLMYKLDLGSAQSMIDELTEEIENYESDKSR